MERVSLQAFVVLAETAAWSFAASAGRRGTFWDVVASPLRLKREQGRPYAPSPFRS
jgi:hypothetical protein